MSAADALVENAGGLTCMEASGRSAGHHLPSHRGHGKDNAE